MKNSLFIAVSAVVLLAAGCNNSVSTNTPSGEKQYTINEVQSANTAEKCWTVVSGSVYNLTEFISKHPGGSNRILSMCGRDATKDFLAQHGGQTKPEQILKSYKIGQLSP